MKTKNENLRKQLNEILYMIEKSEDDETFVFAAINILIALEKIKENIQNKRNKRG